MSNTLILTGTSGSSWRGFTMCFAPSKWEAGGLDSNPVSSGLFNLLEPSTDLSRILASRTKIGVVAFCEHPAVFMATLAKEKESIPLDDALDQWCESARLILSLWRKNRARVHLLNWDECLAFPSDFLAWLQSTTPLCETVSIPYGQTLISSFEKVRRAMCEPVLSAHSLAPSLWGEIQSACRPLSQEYKSPQTFSSRLHALIDLADLEAEHSALLTTLDSATCQLKEAKLELDKHQKELSKTHLLLLKEVQDAFKESQDYFEKWKQTEVEMDCRVAEMQARIDSLEVTRVDRQQLLSDHDSLLEQRNELASRILTFEVDLAKAREAHSYATSQLDAARTDLEKQNGASGKTHRLLLQEVRKAFEESEDHFQRWKSAEADRDRQVAELQARIDSMASRWTWRLGAPLRFCWDKTCNSFIKISRIPIALRILLKHYRSGLFNHEWYFEQNHDVQASTSRPFIHFAFHGVFEGRAPHPAYNETDYLLHNSVVKSSQMPPLVHYVLKGFTSRK